MADNERIGRVTATIFAQIGDGDPIELGVAYIPLTASVMHKNTLNVSLNGVFEVTRDTLQRIYAP